MPTITYKIYEIVSTNFLYIVNLFIETLEVKYTSTNIIIKISEVIYIPWSLDDLRGNAQKQFSKQVRVRAYVVEVIASRLSL